MPLESFAYYLRRPDGESDLSLNALRMLSVMVTQGPSRMLAECVSLQERSLVRKEKRRWPCVFPDGPPEHA